MGLKRKVFLWGTILFFVPLSHSNVYSLERSTHRAINEHLARGPINNFSLKEYLIKTLGFAGGVEENIASKEETKPIREWMADGGLREDEPVWRSFNHYHNPLKPWTEAGLNDTFLRIRFTGQSSVLWAQNPNQKRGGNRSWHDARRLYYQGLTSTAKAGREAAFADSFQTLGQLMHLVQDASVPAHARNQIHIRYNYENWLEDIRTYEDEKFAEFIRSPISFDKSILHIAPDALAPLPIARIVDTGQYYKGKNPNMTLSNAIGIAEYANANFFSEGTVFSKDFPFPAETSVEEADYSIPDPRVESKAVFRKYYRKVGDGETGYRLATVHFLRDYITKYFQNYTGLERRALDGGVYEDYAQRLLPRAVGYSAGLLEYFFRGTIEITPPKQGVYSLTDKPDQGFGRITLLARNTSPEGEEMEDGTIELVIRYKEALEDPFQSRPVPTSKDFTTTVVQAPNEVRSIPRGTAVELVFDLGDKPIPLRATDLYLQVIYRGTLGQEAGAVAVGFKDIREPTPVDYVNNLDRVCLFGNWHVAGSPEAIDLVDPDKDGRANLSDPYPHHLKDIYMKFSPYGNPAYASETNYDHFVPFLGAGDFVRVYILSDEHFHFSSREAVVNTHGDDWFTHPSHGYYLTKSGITNQVVHEETRKCCEITGTPRCGTDYSNPNCCERVYAQGCSVRYHPQFSLFRGVPRWKKAMITHYMTEYPPGTQCSWDVLE